MKRILFAVIFTALFCTVASAEWQEDFNKNYTGQGTEQAVKAALEKGVDPDSIVRQARSLEGMNLQKLVTVFYCAGVRGQDIRNAAADNEISETIVTAGYKASLVECRDAVVRSHGYTPVANEFGGARRARAGGGGGGGKTYGSPSKFQ